MSGVNLDFVSSVLPAASQYHTCCDCVCLFGRAQGHHCWTRQRRENHYPLSVVSLYSAFVVLSERAKTSPPILLWSSLMNEVVHTSPTIGSNVEEIVVKNTHFLMWDIGGQESLRSSWNTYYSNTEVGSTFCRFFFLCSVKPGGGGRKDIVRQLACLFAAQTSAGAAQVKGRLCNKGACLKGKKAGQIRHMMWHHREGSPLV